MLGEHIPQLRYPPTQAGSLLDQIYFQASVSQIERRAHTANTAAHNHSRGWLGPNVIGWSHRARLLKLHSDRSNVNQVSVEGG
jgi:hypothetical protein